jgi:hypothetical protein
MKAYERVRWEAFRNEVIQLDGGVCVHCKRGVADGVVLQVHHKEYIAGKERWDYPYNLCETLCRGCHAREHGRLRPSAGWECVGYHDLGDLDGACDLCGTSIRYVFLVQVPGWPSMEVGEMCCDNLTCTEVASNHMESVRRFEDRKKRFVASKRWALSAAGAPIIKQKGIELEVVCSGEKYRLTANGQPGKQEFQSVQAAKIKAFELIESDVLGGYLRRHGKLS